MLRSLFGLLVVLGIGLQLVLPERIAAACRPVPPGLTHWWTGDGDATDIVGGRHATLQGDAAYGEGWIDEAFVLDGNGDFINVADHPGLNAGTAAFTADLWVRFDTTQGEQVLIEKYVETFGDDRTGWTLTKLPNNVVELAITSDVRIDSAPLTLPLGKWVFFAVRRSGRTFTIFRDGVAIAVGTSAATLDSRSSLKFGHRGNPSDTPGSTDKRNFFLEGGIDEVELFVGRALTDTQIREIFESGRDGKCKGYVRTAPLLSGLHLAFLTVSLAALGVWRQRRSGDLSARTAVGRTAEARGKADGL